VVALVQHRFNILLQNAVRIIKKWRETREEEKRTGLQGGTSMGSDARTTAGPAAAAAAEQSVLKGSAAARVRGDAGLMMAIQCGRD